MRIAEQDAASFLLSQPSRVGALRGDNETLSIPGPEAQTLVPMVEKDGPSTPKIEFI